MNQFLCIRNYETRALLIFSSFLVIHFILNVLLNNLEMSYKTTHH